MAKKTKSKPKSKENLNQQLTLTAHVCAYHCVQPPHTIQYRTVPIIFPFIFRTIIIAQMMSTTG